MDFTKLVTRKLTGTAKKVPLSDMSEKSWGALIEKWRKNSKFKVELHSGNARVLDAPIVIENAQNSDQSEFS